MTDIVEGLGKLIIGALKAVYWVVRTFLRGIGYLAGFRVNAPFFQARLIAYTLISSTLLSPLFMWYAIEYPARAAEHVSAVTLNLVRIRVQAEKLVREVVPDKIERFVDKNAGIRIVRTTYTAGAEATRLKEVPWYHKILSPWRWAKIN